MIGATREDSVVVCPGCGGVSLCAVYRVAAVCRVELTREHGGEIVVGPPLECLSGPGAVTERDFWELRCATCDVRVDWEVDHRSLYCLPS